MAASRDILSAELLSIGSELTVGETRDTNSGEIARSLTELGIEVRRIQALPDDLAAVTEAFATGLERADLVVSTGGLGPTPDDLTREAIGAAVGETPAVDPELETWLRALWSRRGIPMPDMNLKQAWRIPSATALPNGAGTAPAWWVDRPDGRVVVALPGPPREMRPIWRDDVLRRLAARGAGAAVARRTLRLAGIGESAVADRLGEAMLRATHPQVATYARAEAVDVRISARGEDAERLVAETTERVLALIGDHVWAEGETTWSEAIGAELTARGWTMASVEIGTGGTLTALLGDPDWLRLTESLVADAPAAIVHDDEEPVAAPVSGGALPAGAADGLEALARRAAEVGGADVGVGLRIRERAGDTAVTVAIVSPVRAHRERHLAFLGGAAGRSRSALVAASAILTELRRA
ncbi:MAG TPA: molybdopterin-binding protein [Candidatus Limnocylindrales bacterium]|nr:molybdopterin-binding protein [Candidatus Limnocylindrales bacterium]